MKLLAGVTTNTQRTDELTPWLHYYNTSTYTPHSAAGPRHPTLTKVTAEFS